MDNSGFDHPHSTTFHIYGPISSNFWSDCSSENSRSYQEGPASNCWQSELNWKLTLTSLTLVNRCPLSVFCLFLIVIIIIRTCSGDQLWWCIPSGSLPLYCFSLQLLFVIVVNKISIYLSIYQRRRLSYFGHVVRIQNERYPATGATTLWWLKKYDLGCHLSVNKISSCLSKQGGS